MSTIQISCTISATDPAAALGVEVWFDNNQLFNADHFSHESLPLSWEVECNDGEHDLTFVLKNKTEQHTVVDSEGNITKDAMIYINNIALEEIELGTLLTENAVYKHDYNGTQAPVEQKFYGTMGCNGTVKLNFTAPVYMWLLENM